MNLYRNTFNSGVLWIQDLGKWQCFQKGVTMLLNMDFVLERGCGDSGKEGNQIPMFWYLNY